MYKDKQREANKEAMRRNRAKGITEKVSHNQGITATEPKRGKEIKCFLDLPQCETSRRFINGLDNT